MVTVLQASVAPTLGSHPGMVWGLQPIFVSDGQLVKTGAVVSTAQMVCGQVAKLPQASVAFQGRVMIVLVGQTPGAVASVKVKAGVPPQLSLPEGVPVKAGEVLPHSAVASAGQVICGSVMSLTLMVWSHMALRL